MDHAMPSSSAASTVPNVNQFVSGLLFQIPVGITSFCGRQQFLQNLHETLRQNQHGRFATILSQLKVVSGLGGIGKTQTAVKYILEYRKFYDNVIWIQAETESSIRNSFLQLADAIKVSTKNSQGHPEELNTIVQNIYKKLCGCVQSTLFVFDNADDFTSGIEQFLPSMVDPAQKKLVILVTSRNQEWSKKSEKFKVLPLDVLTDEESLSFILMQLEIPDSAEVREETREFVQLMGGLPLALQQSVAYIKEKIRQTGQGYQYSDYINEFRSAAINILDYEKIPGSSSTIFVTWNVTLEKIKTMQHGNLAIEIIKILSFLYADKIPCNFIQSFFPHFCPLEISSALNLLEKYSLIKQEIEEADDENSFVTIHRQLQFVLLQNLKISNSVGMVAENVIKRCQDVLFNIDYAKSADIFVNVHHLIEDPFKVIPITEKSLKFMSNFASNLFNAGRYSESLDFGKNVYNKSFQVLGENHINTLIVQKGMVRNLIGLHKFDDAFTLCQDVLERMITHLGPQHRITLQAKYALTRVLSPQNKIDECLSLSKQLLEEQKVVVGEYDPDTLLTQEMLASLHLEQRDFPAALQMYQEVEIKRIQVLGADHPDTIGTIYNQANILFEMRKYKKASKLFNQAYEQMKQVLGENHPTTMIILGRIADVTAVEGRLIEALKLQKRVLEIRTAVLGPDHRGTQWAAHQVKILQQRINAQYVELTDEQLFEYMKKEITEKFAKLMGQQQKK